MKAKTGMLILALIVTAAIASACGSNSDNTNSGKSNTTSNTTTTNNSTNNTKEADSASSGATHEIKLGAKDFEYDQKEIHVKKGEHVKITLASDDGGHGFTIPDYSVDIQGNGSAEFDAANAGTFEFHCSVMCGSGHRDMKGTIIVDEA
ncbi:cupredoxin domain-containing protein [Paenibacillus sp. OV219]|uniref:cupredoxin domain-containing protein n=1 Tax=Paenibacillus sp. OV219 TaxID=1884377 RepID=UPI0008B01478|nr:cupredoxin domain-containing protein [Paenibacillus sp. OV219]SEO55752.1 cytochrome c oxidase subunit 2 [Paenibacillus sp. OV219]